MRAGRLLALWKVDLAQFSALAASQRSRWAKTSSLEPSNSHQGHLNTGSSVPVIILMMPFMPQPLVHPSAMAMLSLRLALINEALGKVGMGVVMMQMSEEKAGLLMLAGSSTQ